MAGDDMVIGGDDDVRQIVERNRTTPQPLRPRRTPNSCARTDLEDLLCQPPA
jgi:hypothetical protein